MTEVVVASVRGNLQRGYEDRRTQMLRLQAAKHDIWRLLIIVDRLQTEAATREAIEETASQAREVSSS